MVAQWYVYLTSSLSNTINSVKKNAVVVSIKAILVREWYSYYFSLTITIISIIATKNALYRKKM